VNAAYKHSRIKQYLKDGRARCASRTVVNDTADLGCLRRLHHLSELQARARAANRRLLDTERVGQGWVLASPAFERIAHPTRTRKGGPGPAVRRPSGPSPAGALCQTLLAVTGKSLRAVMTGLLAEPYPMTRASYDLTGCAARDSSNAYPAATATGSPPMASPSPSSTANPQPGPATASGHRRHAPRTATAQSRAAHPSNSTSTPGWPQHDYQRRLPETLDKCSTASDEENLRSFIA
jgi:hypothetical protein